MDQDHRQQGTRFPVYPSQKNGNEKCPGHLNGVDVDPPEDKSRKQDGFPRGIIVQEAFQQNAAKKNLFQNRCRNCGRFSSMNSPPRTASLTHAEGAGRCSVSACDSGATQSARLPCGPAAGWRLASGTVRAAPAGSGYQVLNRSLVSPTSGGSEKFRS